MTDINISTDNDSVGGIASVKASSDDAGLFIDLDHYRKLVRTYLDMRRYKTALFWSEKVVTLSNFDPKDIYWEAQCMFLLKEYHRAAHIIRLRGLEKTHIYCHYLCVESLLEAKEYQEAIELLNSVEIDQLASSMTQGDEDDGMGTSGYQMMGLECGTTKVEVFASICLLKGKVLEAMDNRAAATDCYVQALQWSVYCTEALDSLVQHDMLLAWEERELMTNLPFDLQCSEADAKLVKKMYKSKLKKYYELENLANTESPLAVLNSLQTIKELTDKMKNDRANEIKLGNSRRSSKLFTPIQQNILSPANKILQDLKANSNLSIQSNLSKSAYMDTTPSKIYPDASKSKITSTCKTAMALSNGLAKLDGSLDLLVADAEKLFYNCEYKNCMNILDKVLEEDPYHAAGLIILIGCLVAQNEFNKLFSIAHKLVDLYPDQAISWYAVGCYYDLIDKSDPARRYLSKATTLDRLFGPAWLAYGHSFAKENEHDQAMAAYFKATQLMRGCHLPLLYIGVECGLTKNLEMAEKFFYQAMSIAPLDVYVLHEIGVIRYEYEIYDSAEEILRTTLDMVTKMAKKNNESISPRWEPLLSNLGHCCRKNKKYAEALSFHQQALVLKPHTSTTYTAIGLVQALMGNLELAVESLHRSLAIRRDDIVTSALLKNCIEELSDDPTISDNISDFGSEETLRSNVDERNTSPGSELTVDLSSDMSMEV